MTSHDEKKAWLLLVLFSLLETGVHGWLPAWVSVLSSAALAIAVVTRIAPSPEAAWWRRWVSLGLAAGGVAARQALAASPLAFAGLIAAITLRKGTGLRDPASLAARGARAAMALLALTLALSTPLGFYAEELLARILSASGGLLAGHAIDHGPVFGGARAVLVTLAILLAVRPGAWTRCALLAGAAIVLGTLTSAAVEKAAEAIPSFGSSAELMSGGLIAAQLPWIATAVAMLLAWGALRRHRLPARPPRLGPALLVVFALACVIVSTPAASPPVPESIYFYEPGFSNWSEPEADFSVTGEYSAGMLGTLPQFCEALGMTAAKGDDLTAENLARYDSLVFINQNNALDPSTRDAIEEWVRAGGRLVTIGDHTFYIEAEGAEPEIYLNEPLQPTGIRYPNNSADYVVHGFRDSTVNYGLGLPQTCVPINPTGIAIGAGFDIRWPARPLVVGRYGFNDLGVEEKLPTGFIGDLVWNPGERLGNLVIAAEQSLGEGSVVAVGDTTGVTNIGRIYTWEAWSSLLRGSHAESRWLYVAAAVLLLGVLAGVAFPEAGRGPLAAGLIGSAALAAAACAGARSLDDHTLARPAGPTGIVDYATRPDHRSGNWENDGRLAVMINLHRAGLLPLSADTSRTPVLDGAEVCVITAPRVDPGAAWAEGVVDWVKHGGHLVLGCSYPDSRHVGSLLERLGVTVEPKVLGPIFAQLGEIGGTSYQIDLDEPWKLAFDVGGWRSIVYKGRDTAVAERSLGEGHVTMFADGTFLTNGKLEAKSGVNLENLKFLKRVFRGERWRAEDV